MLDFRVMPDGADPFEVTATTRDIIAWEKTTKGASFGQLQADMRMTDLCRVAYFASKRHGLYAGTLAEFEAACDIDVLNPEGAGEPADPTRPVPSGEPS